MGAKVKRLFDKYSRKEIKHSKKNGLMGFKFFTKERHKKSLTLGVRLLKKLN